MIHIEGDKLRFGGTADTIAKECIMICDYFIKGISDLDPKMGEATKRLIIAGIQGGVVPRVKNKYGVTVRLEK